MNHHPAHNSPPQARRLWRSRRHGFVALLVILLLPTFVLLMSLVLNWIYAALVQRDMRRRCEIIAAAAAPELLDEQVLADKPVDQSDDLMDVDDAVEKFRLKTNAAGPAPLELAADNLTIKAGQVVDVTAPVSDGSLLAGSPLNTLQVAASRGTFSSNPVNLLIRGFGGPAAVNVSAVAYVTLDSRLIGFIPKTDRPAPIVPLGISNTAWFVDRIIGGEDCFPAGGNGRLELKLRLRSGAAGAPGPNAALLGLGGNPPNVADAQRQIVDGVLPGDVPSGRLGPATSSSPRITPARNSATSGETATLEAAFDMVRTSGDPRRVFPLYSATGGGQASLVGFVAAVVLDARDIGTAADPQLEVTIEPVFILHPTAWTDPSVPENLYIHKLRISR